jgi:hypothetical protein
MRHVEVSDKNVNTWKRSFPVIRRLNCLEGTMAPMFAGDNACHRKPRNMDLLKTSVTNIAADITPMTAEYTDLHIRAPLRVPQTC